MTDSLAAVLPRSLSDWYDTRVSMETHVHLPHLELNPTREPNPFAQPGDYESEAVVVGLNLVFDSDLSVASLRQVGREIRAVMDDVRVQTFSSGGSRRVSIQTDDRTLLSVLEQIDFCIPTQYLRIVAGSHTGCLQGELDKTRSYYRKNKA